MAKKDKIYTDKELQDIKGRVIEVSNFAKYSPVVNGKSVESIKAKHLFNCWLDYLIIFTKAKKKYPFIVSDEYHRIRLPKEKKFQLSQALFSHFLETNTMDSQIRDCLYAIILDTNDLGGGGLLSSSISPYQREIERKSTNTDLSTYRISQEMIVQFFYYLFSCINVNVSATKKAEIISLLTGLDKETTRQGFSNVHKKAAENYVEFEKNLKFVRKMFEKLKVDNAIELINSDLESY